MDDGRRFPRALGFKLHLDWRERQARGELPGLDCDLYEFLRHSGLHFVEFETGSCLTEDEGKWLRREAVACRDAGLSVVLHPYLGGHHNCAHFGRTTASARALEAVLVAGSTAAELSGAPVLINLHPAEIQYDPSKADPAALRADLLCRSRLFFQEMERRLAASHPGVRVVAEHQMPPARGEPTIRVGDTCAELLEAVAGTTLGLCWDTGHHMLSVERHGQPDEPPKEFVHRVRHVHLHDMVSGRDHRLVGPRSERVRGYMELLQRRGFAGSITLEYALDAILAGGGFEQVARQAAVLLAGWAVT